MFDNLSERLNAVLDRLTRRGALSEGDVDAALQEVRRALIEADVALDVARTFTDEVKKRAVGVEVIKSVTPGQMVVKIVHDQLVEIIRCGVPGGTAMPHFDKFAWTKGEECFGMTEADVGDKKPPNPTAGLQKREIEAIVAYLEAKIVGKGPPTVADCEEYFGQGSGRCRDMAAGRKQ